MKEILADYERQAKDSPSVLQDFHSFKQSLNVASSDQRLLVFVGGANEEESAEIRKKLTPIFDHKDIVGRYHVDFQGGSDKDWKEKLSDRKSDKGIYIVQSDQFGQAGKVLAELSIDSSADVIVAALGEANALYAKNEERKVYSSHVDVGREKGIKFEAAIPYGEDRDGDGEIDARGGGKGKGRGKGR